MKYKGKRKLLYLYLCGAVLVLLLTGCGESPEVPSVEDYKTKIESSGPPGVGEQEPGSVIQTAEGNEAEELDESRQIQEQTFEVTLNPLGEVTFVSYKPDTRKNPLGDAEFALFREGELLSVLPGVYENNIRANECFMDVEAVSFPDYNSDGYEDILIICGYSLSSGPDVGKCYSEVRIFRGSGDGSFQPETELAASANSALAELTVKSVLGFLGAGEKTLRTDSFWQQAYIDYVQQQDPEIWDGYDLIYMDGDDVPELVQVGKYAAAGTKIINFYNGSINETQLRRTFFTYIEKENLLCNSDGNMDSYYDLIYSLEDGRMKLIAQGYYGAEDNSDIKLDKEGNPIYQYKWNGAAVTEKEYETALLEVYDRSRSDGPSNFYSAEEIMKICNSTE